MKQILCSIVWLVLIHGYAFAARDQSVSSAEETLKAVAGFSQGCDKVCEYNFDGDSCETCASEEMFGFSTLEQVEPYFRRTAKNPLIGKWKSKDTILAMGPRYVIHFTRGEYAYSEVIAVRFVQSRGKFRVVDVGSTERRTVLTVVALSGNRLRVNGDLTGVFDRFNGPMAQFWRGSRSNRR